MLNTMLQKVHMTPMATLQQLVETAPPGLLLYGAKDKQGLLEMARWRWVSICVYVNIVHTFVSICRWACVCVCARTCVCQCYSQGPDHGAEVTLPG